MSKKALPPFLSSMVLTWFYCDFSTALCVGLRRSRFLCFCQPEHRLSVYWGLAGFEWAGVLLRRYWHPASAVPAPCCKRISSRPHLYRGKKAGSGHDTAQHPSLIFPAQHPQCRYVSLFFFFKMRRCMSAECSASA